MFDVHFFSVNLPQRPGVKNNLALMGRGSTNHKMNGFLPSRLWRNYLIRFLRPGVVQIPPVPPFSKGGNAKTADVAGQEHLL